MMSRRTGGIVAMVVCVAAGIAAAEEDFGDFKSVTLTTKAWEALGKRDYEKVAAFTGKCRELYAGEAEKQQADLKDFLPKEKGHDAWALNDVGTCCFIDAQAFEQQGRKAEAAAAYKKLADSYGFCQCWDPQGWFWRPAEAAGKALKRLEFDTVLDAK